MLGLLRRLWRFLADTSAAEANRGEVEWALRAALAHRNGEGDFEANLRNVLDRRFGPEGGYDRYLGILQVLGTFRRSYTDGADLRTVAAQVLEDLPRLYGVRAPGGRRGRGDAAG